MSNNLKKSRKYQLTINNPIEHECSHDTINSLMQSIKWEYYCLCDETGNEGTPHTHIFFSCENAISFNTVKKLFPYAHIEACKGSCQENRDYIRKEGKYANSSKKETNHIETFEEYGKMPLERTEKSKNQSEQIVQMIKSGCSNAEIIEQFPSAYKNINHIENCRQMLLEEEYNHPRDVDCYYIYGETGTGKTRSVYDKHGYNDVYKITDYAHPFDNYRGQPVILFDEYRSSLLIKDMLQYLDIYPCRLPARYGDKQACYTTVYIISNIPLEQQYKNIQNDEPETFKAFLRRIKEPIQHYMRGPFDNEPFIVLEDKPIIE